MDDRLDMSLSTTPRPVIRPVRLVIVAWGEQYIAKLLKFTLPAALSPGNYPHLAKMFPCELAIVTETRLFNRLRGSAVVARFEELGGIKLISLDDLLAPGSYGLTLTLGLMRGFEDLAEKITETNILFLNADFILADGSYEGLAVPLSRGERLIMAPSYCAISERVLPFLESRVTQTGRVLSVPKREMADQILLNLHPTVRGQNVRARFHYAHIYVYQFYNDVDERTLLAHQMPIAIVAMRPETTSLDIRTFWDWGAASELCPTTAPYVLADSDDFLMLELRQEQEGNSLVRPGPPDPKMIASLLTPLLTFDQRRCASFLLKLHARDLPSSIEVQAQALADFRDRVLAEIAIDVPHKDHLQWIYHSQLLRRHRDGVVDDRSVPIARDFLAVAAIYDGIFGDQEREATETFKREFSDLLVRWTNRALSDDEAAPEDRVRSLMLLHSQRIGEIAVKRRIVNKIANDLANEFRNSTVDTVAAVSEAQPEPPLIIESLSWSGASSHREDEISTSRLRKIWRKHFGQQPFVSRNHPHWAIYSKPISFIKAAIGSRRILIIGGGSPVLLDFFRNGGRAVVAVSEQLAFSRKLLAQDQFGFCYCEIAGARLGEVPQLLGNIEEALLPDAQVVCLIRMDDEACVWNPGALGRILAFPGGEVALMFLDNPAVLSSVRRVSSRVSAARSTTGLRRLRHAIALVTVLATSAFRNRRIAPDRIWHLSSSEPPRDCVAILVVVHMR